MWDISCLRHSTTSNFLLVCASTFAVPIVDVGYGGLLHSTRSIAAGRAARIYDTCNTNNERRNLFLCFARMLHKYYSVCRILFPPTPLGYESNALNTYGVSTASISTLTSKSTGRHIHNGSHDPPLVSLRHFFLRISLYHHQRAELTRNPRGRRLSRILQERRVQWRLLTVASLSDPRRRQLAHLRPRHQPRPDPHDGVRKRRARGRAARQLGQPARVPAHVQRAGLLVRGRHADHVAPGRGVRHRAPARAAGQQHQVRRARHRGPRQHLALGLLRGVQLPGLLPRVQHPRLPARCGVRRERHQHVPRQVRGQAALGHRDRAGERESGVLADRAAGAGLHDGCLCLGRRAGMDREDLLEHRKPDPK